MLFIAMLNNSNMLVKSKVSTYINGLAEVNIYRKTLVSSSNIKCSLQFLIHTYMAMTKKNLAPGWYSEIAGIYGCFPQSYDKLIAFDPPTPPKKAGFLSHVATPNHPSQAMNSY